MCRPKNKGGRRCAGRSTTRPTTSSSTTASVAADGSDTAGPAAVHAAFLSENGYTGPVDDQGQPTATTSRTRDGIGRPLDEKGRRFFALRDVGYTGPLDQDNNPVADTTGVFAALDAAFQSEPQQAGRPAAPRVTSPREFVAVQVAAVHGAPKTGKHDDADNGGSGSGSGSRGGGDETPPAASSPADRAVFINTGNTRVGFQSDTVVGDLRIQMGR